MKRLVALFFCLLLLLSPAGSASAQKTSAKDLASKYPGDVGIAKDPDVLFVEGFESVNWDKNWQERSRGHRRYGALETDPKIVLGGKRSLKLLFKPQAGKDAAGWMHRWWDGAEVAYLRYYFRLSTGGNWRNQKIMQLHGHRRGRKYGTGAGRRPTGYDWFCTGTGVGGRRGPPWTNIILYTYHPHQRGGYGDNVKPNRGVQPKVPEGKWVCYEFMIKLNDVGKRNGEQRLWIDDKLVIEQKGLEWRKRADMLIDNIMQPTYTHTPPKPGTSRILWIDNIVLAKRYIGPMNTTGRHRGSGSRSDGRLSPPPGWRDGEHD